MESGPFHSKYFLVILASGLIGENQMRTLLQVRKHWMLSVAVLLVCSIAMPAFAQNPADFYVAVDGNDNWSGKLARPNDAGTDGPFATITRARDAVRALKAGGGLKKSLTVLLHGGLYTQNECVTFGPEDSGTDQYSITYAAAPGEKVILSGGRKITGWHKGEGNLWTAQIPAVKNGDGYFRQLFINGRRAVRARTPNVDDQAPWWHIRTCSITIGDNHPPTDEPIIVSLTGPVHPYRNINEVELIYTANNNNARKFLGAVNEAEQTLTLRPPHQWNPRAFGTEWKYSIPDVGLACYLENAPEMLDQPGEWYLDRQTGLLSYWPLPGEDLNQVEAIAPVVDLTLLALIGTPQQPVVNLQFRGIQLEHTKWDIPATGYMGMAVCTTAVGGDPTPGWQWLPAALEFKHARSCRFLDGGVAHAGMLGICLREGTESIAIEGNHVYDTGGGGIGAGYMENAAYGYVHAPSPGPDEFSDYRIANNYVHDCGVEDYAGFGIQLAEAKNSIVSHNLIHDTAYFGMAIAGSQLNRQSPFAANNSIEFNHIYRAMKSTVDGAGMYLTFSQQDRTCLVRGNLLHDITANPLNRRTIQEPGPFLAAGIYLDGAAAGYLIQNNVVYSAWGNLFINGQGPSLFIDNLIQKTTAPPAEFIQVMESLAGLEPPYRKSILNTGTTAYAFYSLEDPADTHWTGYQFHQPAARTGVMVLFRRTGSEKDTAQFRLQNLDEKASYDFTLWQAVNWDGQSVLDHIQPVADPATVLNPDVGQKTGRQLMDDGLSVQITQVPQVLWIVYQQKSR